MKKQNFKSLKAEFQPNFIKILPLLRIWRFISIFPPMEPPNHGGFDLFLASMDLPGAYMLDSSIKLFQESRVKPYDPFLKISPGEF